MTKFTLLKITTMAIAKPFNLNQWIDENRHLLKPPVGNKNVYTESGDYIVMIVAGPNARKDYHYNETEELFYQLEGSIKVVIQEDGERKEMELQAGDMYLNPAKIPHSPVRSLWHCDSCNHKLYEVYFELHNIEKDFLSHFAHFYGSESLRTCSNCGTVMDTDPRFVAKK